MDEKGIVRDSSIWSYPENTSLHTSVDGLIRIGIIKKAFNNVQTGELLYLVETQSNGRKINMSCRMLRRFGGVFNYEDFINRGYSLNDIPDPVSSSDAKAGDLVLIGQLNGQGREGIILGGINHPARITSIQANNGPQYDAEFNGIHTNINTDGEWTLTFRGQPTNISILNNSPSTRIPAPTYDTAVGTTYVKLDKTGSYIVNDNATTNSQFIHINKPAGTITVQSGLISLKMTKSNQAVELDSQFLTVNSTKTITATTTNYSMLASQSAKINSPKIAIGHDSIELLDQLIQLIDALGKVQPISPIGPCTLLSTVDDWPEIEKIKAKINQIRGSL